MSVVVFLRYRSLAWVWVRADVEDVSKNDGLKMMPLK
jgi:hypothetical protein